MLSREQSLPPGPSVNLPPVGFDFCGCVAPKPTPTHTLLLSGPRTTALPRHPFPHRPPPPQGFMDILRDMTAASGTLHVIEGGTGCSVAVVNEWCPGPYLRAVVNEWCRSPAPEGSEERPRGHVPLRVELLAIKQALRVAPIPRHQFICGGGGGPIVNHNPGVEMTGRTPQHAHRASDPYCSCTLYSVLFIPPPLSAALFPAPMPPPPPPFG